MQALLAKRTLFSLISLDRWLLSLGAGAVAAMPLLRLAHHISLRPDGDWLQEALSKATKLDRIFPASGPCANCVSLLNERAVATDTDPGIRMRSVWPCRCRTENALIRLRDPQ